MDTFKHSPFFDNYLNKIDRDKNIEVLLEEGLRVTMLAFKFMSEEKARYAYAEGKWTIKQLFGHMIDTERIMAYRALCISRGEKSSLPGFEEDSYVAAANFNDQNLGQMLEHYKMVRYGNILLFKTFTPEILDRTGLVNGNETNVRSLTYIVAGHEAHHMSVLKEKYGVKV